MTAKQPAHQPMRIARGLGWGHNPLRRHTDRIETATTLAALVLALAALPVAFLAGSLVYQHNLTISAHQTTTRHQVTATLLKAAPHVPAWSATMNTVPATARWNGPHGSRHTGSIPAPPDSAAGTAVRIWTDAHGTLTDPPLNPAQAWGRGALGFLTAMTAALAGLATALALIRRRLTRIRYTDWDTQWQRLDSPRTRHTTT